MPRRPTSATVTAAHAECQECDWRTNNRGALGQAAQHHDRTGHAVETEQITAVTYGHAPRPEDLGQTTLDDVGGP